MYVNQIDMMENRNQNLTVVLAASAAGIVATVATYWLMKKVGETKRDREDDKETELQIHAPATENYHYYNNGTRAKSRSVDDGELSPGETILLKQKRLEEQRLKLEQDQLDLWKEQQQISGAESRTQVSMTPQSIHGRRVNDASYVSQELHSEPIYTTSHSYISQTPPGTWRNSSQYVSPHYSPQMEPLGESRVSQFSLEGTSGRWDSSSAQEHITPVSDSYAGYNQPNTHFDRPIGREPNSGGPSIIRQAYGNSRPPVHPDRVDSHGSGRSSSDRRSHFQSSSSAAEQRKASSQIEQQQYEGVPVSYLRPPEYSESSESTGPYVARQVTGNADNNEIVYDSSTASQQYANYSFHGTPSELSSDHQSVEVSPNLQALSEPTGTGVPISSSDGNRRTEDRRDAKRPSYGSDHYRGKFAAASARNLRGKEENESCEHALSYNRSGATLASSGRSYSHSPETKRCMSNQPRNYVQQFHGAERTGSYGSDKSLSTQKLEADELHRGNNHSLSPSGGQSESVSEWNQEREENDVRASAVTPLRISKPPQRNDTADSDAAHKMLDESGEKGFLKVKKTPFQNEYELMEIIGRGTFSVVKKCRHRHNGEIRAVKCIDTKKFKLSQNWKQSRLLDEVQVLSRLGQHPNIIHLFDVYSNQSDHFVYIVTEYARGGELFDSLVSAGNFSEEQARNVMKQALQAIEFMHAEDIIHRDLKPENILVMNSKEEGENYENESNVALEVKIADFGVARYIGNAAGGASTFCGSPQYVAPEVLFARQMPSKYGKPVDVWSLGVVLYAMLAGYLPFDEYPEESGDSELAQLSWEERIKTGAFTFPPPVWTHISAEAKDLITGMLQVDPEKRLSVKQCLNHQWFAVSGHSPPNTRTPQATPQTTVSQASTSDQIAKEKKSQQTSTSETVGSSQVEVAEAPKLASACNSDEIQLAVKRSLDFDNLLTLLRSTAKHFEAAYRSVKGLPQAPEVIRDHALRCKHLEHQMKYALRKFQSSSENVLQVLDDLELAVKNKDSTVTHELFTQLKDWMSTLKDEAVSVRNEYQSIIWSVQESLQKAKTVSERACKALENANQVSERDQSCAGTSSTEEFSADSEAAVASIPQEERKHNASAEVDDATTNGDETLAIVPHEKAREAAQNALSSLGSDNDLFFALALFLNTPEVAHRYRRNWENTESKSTLPGNANSLLTESQQERLCQALQELRDVDGLLTDCVDFWSSMEVIVDVVVQKKEHSEVLLKHATTQAMLERAAERMKCYRSFWQRFGQLCDHYADLIHSYPSDYSFLND